MALELWAVANRIPGVAMVHGVLLAQGSGAPVATVPLAGLELPQILGVDAQSGDPAPIDSLRGEVQNPDGTGTGADADTSRMILPVPVIPEECR